MEREGRRHRVHLIETGSVLDHMLSFFFSHIAENALPVDPEQAEVAFVDYDAPGAREAIRKFRQKAPSCPVVVFAYQPPAPPFLHLPKPVTLEQLETFLREAPWRSAESQNRPESRQGRSVRQLGLKQPSASFQTSGVWHLPTEELLEADYDATLSLQGWFERAYRRALLTKIPVRLSLSEATFYLFPKEGLWVTPLSRPQLEALCREVGEATVEAAPEATLDQPPGERYPLQALMWEVALYSSRGRLERRLLPYERFSLRAWPNLTRWLRTPNALPIAAFFYNGPHPIDEAVAELAVSKEEVQAFLSAAAAVGLLEGLQTEEAEKGGGPLRIGGGHRLGGNLREEEVTPKKRHPLLRRLLRRLLEW